MGIEYLSRPSATLRVGHLSRPTIQSRVNMMDLCSPKPLPCRANHERRLAKLALLLTLVFAPAFSAGRASAQEDEPMAAGDYEETHAGDQPRLEERTAHTIGGQRLKLGILQIEYGITDRVSVGIDPPAWAARAVLPVFIPNLHAEVVLLESDAFAMSVRAGGYFVDLKEEESAPGTLTTVPVSLFASGQLAPRWWLHGEGMYLYAHGTGTGDFDSVDVSGAVASRAVQLGAMLEYKMTRVVSLTALGRYQPYVGPLVFDGSGEVDPYTTVQVDAELAPRVEHPWQAVAGVAFLWRYVRLGLGVGYGNYFAPGISIAAPDENIVPDLSLSVVL